MAPRRTTRLISDDAGRARLLRHPVLQLRIVGGPAPRRSETRVLTRVVLGSGEGVDFHIQDRTVSALHCELRSDAEGTLVRDLGSRNGVILKDRRVREAYLEPGDTLRLGYTSVKVSETRASEDRLLAEETRFHGLRGGSLAMRKLYRDLELAAQVDASTLVNGETGSGKELAVEALVASSARARGPLVVLNCAALAPGLAESELFGHEAGAFTDARTRALGAFERAQGGTLFLDEVGELPLSLQPKLLGVLERKQVSRLGGTGPIPVDVRVIAATHRPLERMVNDGAFRADLYFRLSGVRIDVPPLRERREDIPELVTHFVSEIPGAVPLTAAMMERLVGADYPGNVRELRSATLRAALGLDELPELPRSALLATLWPPWDFGAAYRPQKERFVAELERRYLSRLLEACGGNVSEAARVSGVNRVQLYQLFQRHQLSPR